ncbi:hypothetical protein HYFRA_00001959 [Hymenoscyphus fraxineus]|uniref:Short chain oxidoreductase n=1 Tax=Hymenoscyphus fraxineus TaxID=746836 RepID=A0A9N9KKY2_9HELO|nr:hypothetical protein HYFRA_00001959 [Hymenoscyphus fraxineus]
MASYLITGTSRGLGLTLVKQLVSRPSSEVSIIFATARSESKALTELAESNAGRISIVQLEAKSESSIKDAVKVVEEKLGGKGLDVLINNAAIGNHTPAGIATMDDLDEHLLVNVIGVHMVTRAFIPLLQRGNSKKIVNITSTLGSIARAHFTKLLDTPGYKISKSALNSLTMQYSLAYEEEGFTIFCISPGWLRTDLGGQHADLDVEVGAKATLEKIIGAGKEQNGKFMDIYVEGHPRYNGEDCAW